MTVSESARSWTVYSGICTSDGRSPGDVFLYLSISCS